MRRLFSKVKTRSVVRRRNARKTTVKLKKKRKKTREGAGGRRSGRAFRSIRLTVGGVWADVLASGSSQSPPGPSPSVRAGSARESACPNLSSVLTGCSSLLSAFLFLLMVVQTFRMKIQEPPVSCDAGRVGGGDADRDKPSCEDVPRLDLTALTEENNWGGRPSGWCFHPQAAGFSHTQGYFVPT